MPQSNPDPDILWQCLIYGGLGSIAGLGALIRGRQELTRRAFFAALLNSAMFSIAVGYFVIWHYGEENYILAIILSILSGLGGVSLLDFLFGMLRIYVRSQAGLEKSGDSDDD